MPPTRCSSSSIGQDKLITKTHDGLNPDTKCGDKTQNCSHVDWGDCALFTSRPASLAFSSSFADANRIADPIIFRLAQVVKTRCMYSICKHRCAAVCGPKTCTNEPSAQFHLPSRPVPRIYLDSIGSYWFQLQPLTKPWNPFPSLQAGPISRNLKGRRPNGNPAPAPVLEVDCSKSRHAAASKSLKCRWSKLKASWHLLNHSQVWSKQSDLKCMRVHEKHGLYFRIGSHVSHSLWNCDVMAPHVLLTSWIESRTFTPCSYSLYLGPEAKVHSTRDVGLNTSANCRSDQTAFKQFESHCQYTSYIHKWIRSVWWKVL